MNTRQSFVFLSVAMSSALLRADIAATDELMEVPWFENAVTADESGWDGYGLVYSDSKYTFNVDTPISFRPTAHAGNAVRQVFDLDLKPVHELPAVDDGAQTAFVMLVTETGHVIMAWGRSTPGDMAATWHELGIPVYGRKLAVEIDYSAGEDVPAVIRYYLTDDNGDTQLGPSLYSANTQVQVTQYDFTGSGTLSSLVGTQTADTAAIIDGVKYSASEITSERLVEALASGVVKVFDLSLVPEGYAVNDNHELYSTGEDPGGGDPEEDDPVEPEEPKNEMLYYFPLEGTVENVGGTRGDQDLTVGETLDWDDGGWAGSPFGEKSLRSSSSETKVYNAAGLVATGSQWTVSFWLTACRENWDWKDACAFRIGEKTFRIEKTNAKEFQVYGSGGEYLSNPIVCGDDWVNVSVVCNSELNAVDLYVGGAYHESMAVADADRLTGFYFSAYGFRDDPTWSQNFVDEVSIWNCALNADQLAYLANRPAKKEILDGETEIEDPEEDDPVEPEEPQKEMLYYFPLEGTVENVGGTRGDQDLTVGETLDWDDGGWAGSPFGEKSLRSSSSETKVYNAAGLVATGSQWTVSFWVTACRENWDWKDACAFRIGEKVFRIEKTNAKEFQVYGSGGEYLSNPIVCGDDWVNVSVVCNSELNAVDLYVGGAYHESMAVADADRLTGFYFSAYGFRDDPTWSQNFVDEVSIWNCALNADQLAYLADHPATAAILEEEPPKGWESVNESTLFSEIPGLTDVQRETLAAKGVTPLRLAGWAIAKEIVYGEVVDVEAFAMNCSPADKSEEAAKLKLTIRMADGGPEVSVVSDADGEKVTKDWNVQPTIKGKVELSDESWGNKDAEGVRFFRAFLCL